VNPPSLDALLDEALFIGDLARTGARHWTDEEDAFLRAHLGYLSDEEIGQALGRTALAVHLRWTRDLGLPAPSKTPGLLTREAVARLLHIDSHAVTRWTREGLLRARPLPGSRGIHVVTELAVLRFVTNPRNWIYFQPERVTDPHLRRLLDRQKERWADEWWTPQQVADYHGVHHTHVNDKIRRGELPAVKWQNHRILRSHATDPNLKFYVGEDAMRRVQVFLNAWSPAAEAFLVLAHAVGVHEVVVATLMKTPISRSPENRLASLRRRQRLASIIAEHDLPVAYDADTGLPWADWRRHTRRFPWLARTMVRFEGGRDLSVEERLTVRRVLYLWAMHFARSGVQRALAERLHQNGGLFTTARLRDEFQFWRERAIDPLAPLA
jgi:hypothetical protein